MYDTKDNIVALATSPGRSAINVVRASGPNIKAYVQSLLLNHQQNKLKPNRCSVVALYNPSTKEILDKCVVSFFKNPKSYTGQDVVEISTHGGTVIAQKIISILCLLGCRHAHEGEFSYRAFINGKIDLIQAEAISSIINTNSDIDVLFSLENLSGKLSKKINSLLKQLKEIITYMEHELDFNEGEIDLVSFNEYCDKIDILINETKNVVGRSFIANQKTNDLTVSILGKPNVGKSSLFNALLGYDRSIVTKTPGTTRDLVDAQLVIEGLQVSLIDTAGIRKTKNSVEEEGIKRAEEKIKESDLIILVDDKNPEEAMRLLKIKKNNLILVQNKIDLASPDRRFGVFFISCKNGEGLNELFTYLSTYILKHRSSFLDSNSFVVSARVASLLGVFTTKLIKTTSLLKSSTDLSVIASSLYDAYDVFLSSANPSNKEEIINNIFKGFCVGK